jgi:hypothetical protein
MIAGHTGIKLGSLYPFTLGTAESSHFSFKHAGYFTALSSPQYPNTYSFIAAFQLPAALKCVFIHFSF